MAELAAEARASEGPEIADIRMRYSLKEIGQRADDARRDQEVEWRKEQYVSTGVRVTTEPAEEHLSLGQRLFRAERQVTRTVGRAHDLLNEIQEGPSKSPKDNPSLDALPGPAEASLLEGIEMLELLVGGPLVGLVERLQAIKIQVGRL